VVSFPTALKIYCLVEQIVLRVGTEVGITDPVQTILRRSGHASLTKRQDKAIDDHIPVDR
jgi:hypothetical protein